MKLNWVHILVVKNALRRAELFKGAPVNNVEIYRELLQMENTEEITKTIQTTVLHLYEMYRTDQILADHELNYFSLRVEHQKQKDYNTGFDLCSDRMFKKFDTYQFDEEGRIVPGKDTATINFK